MTDPQKKNPFDPHALNNAGTRGCAGTDNTSLIRAGSRDHATPRARTRSVRGSTITPLPPRRVADVLGVHEQQVYKAKRRK